MKISKQQFTEELEGKEQRKHNLIFIGMSGVGKTHWSKALEKEYNYKHVDYDSLIGKSDTFVNLISTVPGETEVEKLGNYFGKPWDPQFNEREADYLQVEAALMSKTPSPNSILDLSGSSVYHPDQMKFLSTFGLVIYLGSTIEKQEEMLQIYMNDPKPVCWHGLFERYDEESNEEALSRCYARLLKHRSHLYEKYSDIVIPYDIHKNVSVSEFISEIQKRL